MDKEYGKEIKALFEKLKNDSTWEKDPKIRENVATNLWYTMEGQTK